MKSLLNAQLNFKTPNFCELNCFWKMKFAIEFNHLVCCLFRLLLFLHPVPVSLLVRLHLYLYCSLQGTTRSLLLFCCICKEFTHSNRSSCSQAISQDFFKNFGRNSLIFLSAILWSLTLAPAASYLSSFAYPAKLGACHGKTTFTTICKIGRGELLGIEKNDIFLFPSVSGFGFERFV